MKEFKKRWNKTSKCKFYIFYYINLIYIITKGNERKINKIVNDCLNFEQDGAKILNRLQFEQDFGKISRDEFNCTLSILKENEFANGNVLDHLYHKRKQDFRDDNEYADKAAKEYHSRKIKRMYRIWSFNQKI